MFIHILALDGYIVREREKGEKADGPKTFANDKSIWALLVRHEPNPFFTRPFIVLLL